MNSFFQARLQKITFKNEYNGDIEWAAFAETLELSFFETF